MKNDERFRCVTTAASPVSLESVLCTEELDRRPSRPPDYQSREPALVSLARPGRLATNHPANVGGYDPGGIRLRIGGSQPPHRRRETVSLAVDRRHVEAAHRWRHSPRFGPCGDVLDRMSADDDAFERRYTYFPPVTPLVEECLLVPFYVEGKAVGTIWAITHDPPPHESLTTKTCACSQPGPFASSAYWAIESLGKREHQAASLRQSEERYRAIFDGAAVSLWEEDFSGVKAAIDELRAQGVTDFRCYFAQHPEFVANAMGRIRVLNVNDNTLKMFESRDKTELLGNLPKIFVPESLPVFVEELLTVAEGRTFMQAEALLNTVRGNPIWTMFTMTIPQAPQKYDRVLFSLLDIRELKQAERPSRKRRALPHAGRQHQPTRLDLRQARQRHLVQPALARLHRPVLRGDEGLGLDQVPSSRSRRSRGRRASRVRASPAKSGRTRSRCAARTASIAGSSPARFPFATRGARSCAGSAPTPT